MNPFTHALVSWAVAVSSPLERRERTMVVVAGIAADFDGFGVVIDIVTKQTSRPTDYWTEYHHILGHNLGFCLLLTAVALFLAGNRRVLTAFLVLAVSHLHLLGDLIGARGPDGYQWPIPYLQPFSDNLQLTWSGQWQLNAWPNIAATCLLLLYMFYMSWKTTVSPLNCFSEKWNRVFVATLHVRFGKPASIALLSFFVLFFPMEALACGACYDQQILWTIPAVPLLAGIAALYFLGRKLAGFKSGFLGCFSILAGLIVLSLITGGSVFAPLLALICLALIDFSVLLFSKKASGKGKRVFLFTFGVFWVIALIFAGFGYQPGQSPRLKNRHSNTINSPPLEQQKPVTGQIVEPDVEKSK